MEAGLGSDDSNNLLLLQQRLVDQLILDRYIRTAPVEAAFRTIPRHQFVPSVPVEHVYQNQVIPTVQRDGIIISSSTRPGTMAIMLEQLGLEPGQRVLEIGAGTGYNAALIAHIIGATGSVVTVDIDHDVTSAARVNLQRAGFNAVHVVEGDGGFGYPSLAPYDRIILTVGASDIAPAWRAQLRADGRLVMPLSLRGPMKSVAFEPQDDCLVSISVQNCGFMRLRGSFAGPEVRIAVGPEPELALELAQPRRIDTAALDQWLRGPSTDWNTQVIVTAAELLGSLNVWLALRESDSCALHAAQAAAENGRLPGLLDAASSGKRYFTSGMLSDIGVCVLMGPPDQLVAASGSPPFELWVRSFGRDMVLTQRLLGQVAAWDQAGRPASQQLRVRAYPIEIPYMPTAQQTVIYNRWSQLVLEY